MKLILMSSLIAVACLVMAVPAEARRYPPHGYPCLGCAPCPGNPTEFCDTVGSASFTQGQNTRELREEGYEVKNGRIVKIRPNRGDATTRDTAEELQ